MMYLILCLSSFFQLSLLHASRSVADYTVISSLERQYLKKQLSLVNDFDPVIELSHRFSDYSIKQAPDLIELEFSIDSDDFSKYEVKISGLIRKIPGVNKYYLDEPKLDSRIRTRLAQQHGFAAARMLERRIAVHFTLPRSWQEGFNLNQKVQLIPLVTVPSAPDEEAWLGPQYDFVFTLEDLRARNREARRLQLTEIFDRKRIYDPPEDCYLHLLEEEERAGERFDEAKILQFARDYLHSTGRELMSRRCFTCHAQVLTPTGYRPIAELRPGDFVMSYDVLKQSLVKNQIRQVHVAFGMEYGVLHDHSSLAGPLEVTSDHPFFLPNSKTQSPIGQIMPTQNLLKVEMKADHCETLLIPRGNFEPGGTGTVYTFTLELQPDNYIVNGLVVLNKPIFPL